MNKTILQKGNKQKKQQKIQTLKKWTFVFLVLINLISIYKTQSQNSKCFQRPTIWLRADQGGKIPGQWMDVSGNGHHAMLQNNQVSLDTCLFNFQKSFVFDTASTSLEVNYITREDARLLVFAVYKSEYSQAEKGIWLLQLDSNMQVGLTTKKLKTTYKEINYSDNTASIPIINLVSQNWDGIPIDSTISKLYIAGTDSLNFIGKFAEFILYDTAISPKDIYKLHTYLAIKYGVSIKDMNYQDSNDTIMWDVKKNTKYNNDIAGIGKDTIIDIDQKQSAGNGGDSPLIIAANKLKSTNNENNSELTNGNFLIWGCNKENLYEINTDTIDKTIVPNVSKCVWLMRTIGNSASSISTQLVLNASQYIGEDTIKLVINRGGDTLYPKSSSIVIAPDSIDLLKNYYYTGIQWDTDNSGSDIFSFQMSASGIMFSPNQVNGMQMQNRNNIIYNNNIVNKQENTTTTNNIENSVSIINYSVFPNPTTQDYTINVNLTKESPVYITIQDAQGRILKFFNGVGSDSYIIKDCLNKSGSYIISIETDFEKKTFKQIVTK